MSGIVFIVGAGFSKDAAQFPTLPELTRIAVARWRTSAKSPFTWQSVEQILPMSVLSDLERLLTYLFTSHPWQDQTTTLATRAAYFDLARHVRGVFEDADAALADESLNPAALTLVRWMHRNESTVITFNYDTLLERLSNLATQVKWAHTATSHHRLPGYRELIVRIVDDYPGTTLQPEASCTFDQSRGALEVALLGRQNRSRGALNAFGEVHGIAPGEIGVVCDNVGHLLQSCRQPVPTHDLYQLPLADIRSRTDSLFSGMRSPTFRLLKLHGSSNWYYAGSQDSVAEQIYFSRVGTASLDDHAIIELNRRDLDTLLIPPVLDKSAFFTHKGLRAQWSLASQALSAATTVVVIGYSMPETDLVSQFLIGQALRDTPASVHLFTKSNEKDAARLRTRYEGLVCEGPTSRVHITNVGADESSIDALNRWLSESGRV